MGYHNEQQDGTTVRRERTLLELTLLGSYCSPKNSSKAQSNRRVQAKPRKLRSWAPKVLMCQAIGGLRELLSYWNESKLSFDSLIPLYDKGTSWDSLLFFFLHSFLSFPSRESGYSCSGTKAWHIRIYGAQLRTGSKQAPDSCSIRLGQLLDAVCKPANDVTAFIANERLHPQLPRLLGP